MAYSVVPTVATGDLWTAANHNTYLKDNLAALWPYTTAGDMVYASSPTMLARKGIGTPGQKLQVNSGGNAPEWADATPVTAIYSTNAGQSIANSTDTVVNFEDQEVDTNSAVSVGAGWVFTAPKAGYYQVNVQIMFTSTSGWADGEVGQINLFKNGSLLRGLDRKDNYASGSPYMLLNGATVVYLAQNDTINIKVSQTSGGALALHNDGKWNWIAIVLQS